MKKDPSKRSLEFVHYGIGQEFALIEHYKSVDAKEKDSDRFKKAIDAMLIGPTAKDGKAWQR